MTGGGPPARGTRSRCASGDCRRNGTARGRPRRESGSSSRRTESHTPDGPSGRTPWDGRNRYRIRVPRGRWRAPRSSAATVAAVGSSRPRPPRRWDLRWWAVPTTVHHVVGAKQPEGRGPRRWPGSSRRAGASGSQNSKVSIPDARRRRLHRAFGHGFVHRLRQAQHAGHTLVAQRVPDTAGCRRQHIGHVAIAVHSRRRCDRKAA